MPHYKAKIVLEGRGFYATDEDQCKRLVISWLDDYGMNDYNIESIRIEREETLRESIERRIEFMKEEGPNILDHSEHQAFLEEVLRRLDS